MNNLSHLKISRQEVSDRLEDIRNAAKELERFKSMDPKTFRKSKDNQAIASHYLSLSIGAVLTIEAHLRSRLPKQNSQEKEKKETDPKKQDIQAYSLEKYGILPKGFEKRIKGMSEYRNRMMDRYWEVQPEELLEAIQKGLPDFKEFEKHITDSFSLGPGIFSNASVLSLLLAVTIIGSFFFFQKDPQQSEAALTVNSPVPNNASITTGLGGHWTFDGPDVDWSDTNAEIKDISGNGNDGDASTSGMDETNATEGKIGQGMNFQTSSSNIVDCGSDATLDNLSAISVAMWIKPHSDCNGCFFASKLDVGDGQAYNGNTGWIFKYHDNGGVLDKALAFYAGYSTGKVYQTTDNGYIVLNEWQHIAVTWDGSTTGDQIHIYVNGSEVENYSDNGNGSGSRDDDSSYDLLLGSGDESYDGDMDDVRIYNRVLSAEEVEMLYDLGR